MHDARSKLDTVPSVVVAGLVAYAIGRGIPPHEVLAAISVTPAALADPDGRLPIAAGLGAWAFLRARFPEDCLPLDVATRLDLSVAGLLGQIVRHSPTLRVGLERMTRYQRVQHPGFRMRVDEGPERTVCTIGHLAALHELVDPIEFIAAMHVRAARLMLGGDDVGLAEVRFSHEPRGARAGYERFFGVPVHFGQPTTALVYRPGALDRPVVGFDPAVERYLVAYADVLLRDIPEHTPSSTADDVRRAIDRTLQRGAEPTPAAVARTLATSTRTLQRRLAGEGASFASLYDEARKSAALRLMRRREVTLHEIAFLLHFSDAAGFHRAFRRWTGRTPAEMRRELGA